MEIIVTGLLFAAAGAALGLYINKNHMDDKNREILRLKKKIKKYKKRNHELNKHIVDLYTEIDEITSYDDEEGDPDNDDEDQNVVKKMMLHKKLNIDKLLDKISKVGYDNLSEDEKTFLKNFNK